LIRVIRADGLAVYESRSAQASDGVQGDPAPAAAVSAHETNPALVVETMKPKRDSLVGKPAGNCRDAGSSDAQRMAGSFSPIPRSAESPISSGLCRVVIYCKTEDSGLVLSSVPPELKVFSGVEPIKMQPSGEWGIV